MPPESGWDWTRGAIVTETPYSESHSAITSPRFIRFSLSAFWIFDRRWDRLHGAAELGLGGVACPAENASAVPADPRLNSGVSCPKRAEGAVLIDFHEAAEATASAANMTARWRSIVLPRGFVILLPG